VSEDFDVLDTPTEQVGEFLVSPITVERLPFLTRTLRPMLPQLQTALASFNGSEEFVVEALTDLVADQGERLVDAVACAVAEDLKGLPEARKKVGALNPVAFLRLLVACVKVNGDFFAHRLLPLALQAAAEMKAPSNGDGPTPSKP